MILKLLLGIITTFTTGIFGIIGNFLPTINVTSNIAQTIAAILNISTQALNFVHFIVGDSLVIIIPMVIALITYKYIVYPIIDVVRRLIPFVNL